MGDTSARPGPEPHELHHQDGPWPDPGPLESKADYDRYEKATDAEQAAREGATAAPPPALPVCPHCGLAGELRPTLSSGWILLEPQDVTERLPAHAVPPRQRWYVQDDGTGWNSWDAEPPPGAVCRLNHTLVCPGLNEDERPPLWRWLTVLREENARRAQRQADVQQLEFDRNEPA